MTNQLQDIVYRNRSIGQGGIPSYCTAHRETLQAILRFYRDSTDCVLIESTCNQVNQEGGYTGLTPAGFRDFVFGLAHAEGIESRRMILGGDHLGPNPWKSAPAGIAMAKASEMVRSYVEAGFRKIHLDTSMACAGDGALSEELISARAAELCAVAEQYAIETKPLYVIGTEVPRPGGETDSHHGLVVTHPQAPVQTFELHKQAFSRRGLAGALERVIGIVVQPGVDFSNTNIHRFDMHKATSLSAAVIEIPGVVFEAHSTDYQSRGALQDLVKAHFAILKVGPELTAAYREAVVSMASFEEQLPLSKKSGILDCILNVMNNEPKHWQGYVAQGARCNLELLFGLSDRIRYYWPQPKIQNALKILYANIDAATSELGLISQYANLQSDSSEGGQSLSQQIVQSRVGAVAAKYCSVC